MPVIKANLELCEGYANCMASAEDIFDIDDDGSVVILRPSIPEDERARAEEAARQCPVSALRVEDD